MSDHRKERDRSRPTIEWAFGIVSAIIVGGVIAFLTYEAVFGGSTPPDLAVTIVNSQDVENGTLVVVAVTNRGDAAAAQVGVQAFVTKVGVESAVGEIVFDYIAAHAVRRGVFIVPDSNIEKGDIRVTVEGFVEP